jgi:hypothetical protein
LENFPENLAIFSAHFSTIIDKNIKPPLKESLRNWASISQLHV